MKRQAALSLALALPLALAIGLSGFLGAAAGGCKKDPPPPAPSQPSAAVSAITPPAASSSKEEPARPKTNLLLTTAAEVTVSSRVDNPRDFPEHLVDGKPATAWNGKTGDVNAWIEIKLDPKVHVAAIAITAGFDKGDLFEKNLRIERLRIERDGILLKEATLDPKIRRQQRIPIVGPGGTYRLTVTSTIPGTNPKWNEIVVSDLEVIGEAPESVRLATPRLPLVKVAPGSAAPPKRADNTGDVKIEGRRGASILAICEAWKKELLAVVRKWPGVHEHAECKVATPPPLVGTRPPQWKSIGALERLYFDGVAEISDHDLMIEIDGGWMGGPTYRSWNDIGDSPGHLATGLEILPTTPPKLVVATVTSMPHWPNNLPDGGFQPVPGAVVEHEARTCTITGLDLVCEKESTRYERVDLASDAEVAALAKRPVVFPPLDPAGKIKPLTD